MQKERKQQPPIGVAKGERADLKRVEGASPRYKHSTLWYQPYFRSGYDVDQRESADCTAVI